MQTASHFAVFYWSLVLFVITQDNPVLHISQVMHCSFQRDGGIKLTAQASNLCAIYTPVLPVPVGAGVEGTKGTDVRKRDRHSIEELYA